MLLFQILHNLENVLKATKTDPNMYLVTEVVPVKITMQNFKELTFKNNIQGNTNITVFAEAGNVAFISFNHKN